MARLNNKATKKVKILWAFDPFVESEKIYSNTVKALKVFSIGKNVEIYPIYFLVPNEIDLVAATLEIFSLKSYKEAAEKKMRKFFSKINLKGLMKPQILLNPVGSKRSAIIELNKFSKKMNADFVFTSTHARKGLARYFLGSFSETLLLKSITPVIVVSPTNKITGSFQRTLFATDFSVESFLAFQILVKEVKDWPKATVILFHQTSLAVDPIISSELYAPGRAYGFMEEYLDKVKDFSKREAKKWSRWAENEGVQVEICIQNFSDRTSDAIVKRAKKSKATLIALAAKTGPKAAVLIGSIPRQIVRQAAVPVWVLYTHNEVKQLKKIKRDKIRVDLKNPHFPII